MAMQLKSIGQIFLAILLFLSINLSADDTNLFLSHKIVDTLQKTMNQELRKILHHDFLLINFL